ncbi:hypothetical protein IF2G_10996 [Cordyceps javanica]|nr:hypothetical protein IF2G_10996 [Cordyceps javanica]
MLRDRSQFRNGSRALRPGPLISGKLCRVHDLNFQTRYSQGSFLHINRCGKIAGNFCRSWPTFAPTCTCGCRQPPASQFAQARPYTGRARFPARSQKARCPQLQTVPWKFIVQKLYLGCFHSCQKWRCMLGRSEGTTGSSVGASAPPRCTPNRLHYFPHQAQHGQHSQY